MATCAWNPSIRNVGMGGSAVQDHLLLLESVCLQRKESRGRVTETCRHVNILVYIGCLEREYTRMNWSVMVTTHWAQLQCPVGQAGVDAVLYCSAIPRVKTSIL